MWAYESCGTITGYGRRTRGRTLPPLLEGWIFFISCLFSRIHYDFGSEYPTWYFHAPQTNDTSSSSIYWNVCLKFIVRIHEYPRFSYWFGNLVWKHRRLLRTPCHLDMNRFSYVKCAWAKDAKCGPNGIDGISHPKSLRNYIQENIENLYMVFVHQNKMERARTNACVEIFRLQ
jgi:hypothetical protein